MTNEAQYIRQVAKLYGVTIDEIIAATRRIRLSPDEAFSFDDFPSLKGKSDKIFEKFAKSLMDIIDKATEAEWKRANKNVDAMIHNMLIATFSGGLQAKKNIIPEETIPKRDLSRYVLEHNRKASSAFQTRQANRFNLSDRVWKVEGQLRQEMELALSKGISEGLSADELARKVKKYLREPENLFRRVRDEHGNLQLSKAAKEYHPGRGVYRSSYKNAMRLVRTEINMAYRRAELMRWRQLYFVVGYEVKLSNNHTINGMPFVDICDELTGKYPKDFEFLGWHPQCRCFAVPINMTIEEMKETNRMFFAGEDISGFKSKNAVEDLPENFKKWLIDNADRIEKANKRGTLPYFLRDNKNIFKV